MLVRVSYEDRTGRKWMTLVPQGHEKDAEWGIPIGPPDTRSLGLPEDVDISLNHQLFNRKLFTEEDARRRPKELTASIQVTLRLGATRLMNIYKEVNDGSRIEQE